MAKAVPPCCLIRVVLKLMLEVTSHTEVIEILQEGMVIIMMAHLADAAGIDEATVTVQLWRASRESISKNIKSTDKFFFNEIFYSNFTKIKIDIVISSNWIEVHDKWKETKKKNNNTRDSIIETAIIQIMKYISLVLLLIISY